MVRLERARDLIQRHIDGILTEDESVELGRSIAEDPAVAALFASMTRLDYAIETSVAGQKNAAQPAPVRAGGTKFLRFLRRWRWAAAVMLSLAPSVLMYLFMTPSAKGMAMGFDLSAAVVPSGGVRLTWQDHMNDEEGFQIEKSADGVEYQEIARVGTDVAEYLDEGLRVSNISYYRVRAFNAKGRSEYSSAVGIVTAPQSLINISARGYVAKAPNLLVAGIVITGNDSRKLLIRALGPTLADAGMKNMLKDPMLTVYSNGKAIAHNNDWETDDPAADRGEFRRFGAEEIKATGMAPGSPPLRSDSRRESAILIVLPPGLYTASVRSADGSSGTAIVEVIEVK